MTAERKQQEPFHWRTGVAYKTRDRIVVRGYDLNDLTGNLDLVEMAYLVWRGELPGESHASMLNAIMVCLAEHAFSGTDQNAAIHLYTHERACPEARSARGRGVSNNARARQRPWISAVSARADSRAA